MSPILDLCQAFLASHKALVESMQNAMTLFSRTLPNPLHGTSLAGVVLTDSGARHGTYSDGTVAPVYSTHGDAVAFADTSPALPSSIAAPPNSKTNKNEVHAKPDIAVKTQERLFVAGKTIWVGNLPAGVTYKELKSHAQKAGTAPEWAVVYRSPDARTGAIGFKTPNEASNAVDILNGSLFKGILIATASW